MRSRHLAPLALGLLAAAHLAAAAEPPGCPAATSIFDLPDIHSCWDALASLRERQPCAAAAPGPCCQPAAAFLAAGCHCWPAFDGAALLAVQAAAAGCPAGAAEQQQPGQEQHQQQQQQLAAGQGPGEVRLGGGGGGANSPSWPRLYVGVLSSSANRGRRDAIRAAWGSHPGLHRLRFFLARSPNDTLFDQARSFLPMACLLRPACYGLFLS